MYELHRRALRKNRVILKDELDLAVLDHLFSIDVINQGHLDIIAANKTKGDRVAKLLEILPGRGSGAFTGLVKCLKKTQEYLATMLERDCTEDDAHTEGK